jgi:hypothetical protein
MRSHVLVELARRDLTSRFRFGQTRWILEPGSLHERLTQQQPEWRNG